MTSLYVGCLWFAAGYAVKLLYTEVRKHGLVPQGAVLARS